VERGFVWDLFLVQGLQPLGGGVQRSYHQPLLDAAGILGTECALALGGGCPVAPKKLQALGGSVFLSLPLGDLIRRDRVPDLGGFLLARGDDPLAVWRKSGRVHLLCVSFERQELLAAGRVPQLCGVIKTGRDNPPTVRRERDIENKAVMAEFEQFLAAVR